MPHAISGNALSHPSESIHILYITWIDLQVVFFVHVHLFRFLMPFNFKRVHHFLDISTYIFVLDEWQLIQRWTVLCTVNIVIYVLFCIIVHKDIFVLFLVYAFIWVSVNLVFHIVILNFPINIILRILRFKQTIEGKQIIF